MGGIPRLFHCVLLIIISINSIKYEMTNYPTGGVFLYLPHHLDLASEDSVVTVHA